MERTCRLARTPGSGSAYKKDANGNYRFVYSGKDAQAGRNVNAIIVEMPLAYITSRGRRTAS